MSITTNQLSFYYLIEGEASLKTECISIIYKMHREIKVTLDVFHSLSVLRGPEHHLTSLTKFVP